jgi:hypothetical protein
MLLSLAIECKLRRLHFPEMDDVVWKQRDFGGRKARKR